MESQPSGRAVGSDIISGHVPVRCGAGDVEAGPDLAAPVVVPGAGVVARVVPVVVPDSTHTMQILDLAVVKDITKWAMTDGRWPYTDD